jgi:beta-phosphoglucomutase-like phosphatase (HAD superfamily)
LTVKGDDPEIGRFVHSSVIVVVLVLVLVLNLATNDSMVCSLTLRGKPSPDIFLLAATRLGVSPAQCLVVEDSPVGVQAARAAGMASLFVPHHSILPLHAADVWPDADTDTFRAAFALDAVVVDASATLSLPSLTLLDPSRFGLPPWET